MMIVKEFDSKEGRKSFLMMIMIIIIIVMIIIIIEIIISKQKVIKLLFEFLHKGFLSLVIEFFFVIQEQHLTDIEKGLEFLFEKKLKKIFKFSHKP